MVFLYSQVQRAGLLVTRSNISILGNLIYVPVFLIITLCFYSCDESEEGPPELDVTLNLIGKSYHFNPIGGSRKNDGSFQAYTTPNGSRTENAVGEIVGIKIYTELFHLEENVSLKIGFSLYPGSNVEYIQCSTWTNALLTAEASRPLCHTYKFHDSFLTCKNSSQDTWVFGIEFTDLDTGQKYRSGIRKPSENSFFRVDSIAQISYDDPAGNITSYDFWMEGEFNEVLYSVETDILDSIQMNDSQFKIGIWNSECFE